MCEVMSIIKTLKTGTAVKPFLGVLAKCSRIKLGPNPWRCWHWGFSAKCGRQLEDRITGLLSNGTNREFIKENKSMKFQRNHMTFLKTVHVYLQNTVKM